MIRNRIPLSLIQAGLVSLGRPLNQSALARGFEVSFCSETPGESVGGSQQTCFRSQWSYPAAAQRDPGRATVTNGSLPCWICFGEIVTHFAGNPFLNMPTHFEESLERDIDRIRSKVSQMGSLCQRALKDCIRALRARDTQAAYSVILRDRRIDELEKEVDRLCLEFLVRQQPAGQPLRMAYSTIRINFELERVGDYAESIARQSLKLMPDSSLAIPIERLEEIADLSIPMLRDAVAAFVEQDAELARTTMQTEETVDVLKSKLNKDIVALFHNSKIPFEALNPLMMITRRLERVSDQAKSICMEVLYMCTGEYRHHPAAGTYRLLFVDQRNSCRSQIAESIAHSLTQPRFLFASAGIAPQPIDPATIEFLQSKGLDAARLRPKAISEIPDLNHYHVIVGLAAGVQKAIPPASRKVVFLDWTVDDPSIAKGTPADVRAAYEQTYEVLHRHIKDLVEAVLGDEDE
jgi:phosphate transport system protein